VKPSIDRAVVDAKSLADDFTDAPESPQLGGVPGRAGATEQQRFQLALLLGRQATGTSWDRTSAQPFALVSAMRLFPSDNRTQRCRDLPRDLTIRRPGLQEGDRPATPLLQLLSGP
jgi:hypothetical protein